MGLKQRRDYVGTSTYVESITTAYVNPYQPLIQVKISARNPVHVKWLQWARAWVGKGEIAYVWGISMDTGTF